MKLSYVSFVCPIWWQFRRCSELDVSKHSGLSLSLVWLPELQVSVARLEEDGRTRDVPMTNVGSWTVASTSQSLPEASKPPAGPELPTRSAEPTEGTQGAPRKKVGKTDKR
jgi:hypothetical protein